MHSAETGLKGQALYNVIAGVGNSEMKGIVFGEMRDGVSYTATPLHAKTTAAQGDKPGWPVALTTPFGYCETFSNVGLVAKSTTEPLAYTINNRGKNIAIPLVGHLLDVSLQEEPSLYGFHGPAASQSDKKVRANEHRLGLMQQLREADGDSIPLAQVASRLGIRIGNAGSIADDLAFHNIVEHESSGRGKSTVLFIATTALEGITLRTDFSSQLLFDVVDVLQKHFRESDEPVDNKSIAATLIENYDYTEDITTLIKKVSRRTNMLASKRGALTAKRDVEGDKSRGVVSATETQLATIENLLTVIDGVAKPTKEYLFDGHDKLEVILSDPDMVSHLTAKARADSVGLKRLPDDRLRNINLVKKTVVNSEQALTIRDIQASLLDTGLNLDRATIREYIDEFIESGGITVAESEQGNKYAASPL